MYIKHYSCAQDFAGLLMVLLMRPVGSAVRTPKSLPPACSAFKDGGCLWGTLAAHPSLKSACARQFPKDSHEH